MVSQKNQATDSFFSLQVSQIHEDVMYVGEITTFQGHKKHVIYSEIVEKPDLIFFF